MALARGGAQRRRAGAALGNVRILHYTHLTNTVHSDMMNDGRSPCANAAAWVAMEMWDGMAVSYITLPL